MTYNLYTITAAFKDFISTFKHTKWFKLNLNMHDLTHMWICEFKYKFLYVA